MPPAVSASIEATTRRCLDILLNLFEQNTQCNLHNKSIAHYKYLSDINIYQCQYIADIRYQCSAVLGCRDRLGGDRDCVGSGPGPCRVGGGTVPGGGGWRDGVAVLGGTVSVRPGTVTVWPGSVTVWPGSVTEGVPRRGYRGPSKTTSRYEGDKAAHRSVITLEKTLPVAYSVLIKS